MVNGLVFVGIIFQKFLRYKRKKKSIASVMTSVQNKMMFIYNAGER